MPLGLCNVPLGLCIVPSGLCNVSARLRPRARVAWLVLVRDAVWACAARQAAASGRGSSRGYWTPAQSGTRTRPWCPTRCRTASPCSPAHTASSSRRPHPAGGSSPYILLCLRDTRRGRDCCMHPCRGEASETRHEETLFHYGPSCPCTITAPPASVSLRPLFLPDGAVCRPPHPEGEGFVARRTLRARAAP